MGLCGDHGRGSLYPWIIQPSHRTKIVTRGGHQIPALGLAENTEAALTRTGRFFKPCSFGLISQEILVSHGWHQHSLGELICSETVPVEGVLCGALQVNPCQRSASAQGRHRWEVSVPSCSLQPSWAVEGLVWRPERQQMSVLRH